MSPQEVSIENRRYNIRLGMIVTAILCTVTISFTFAVYSNNIVNAIANNTTGVAEAKQQSKENAQKNNEQDIRLAKLER